MGTNCAPLVADLFLFSYERDFMLSLSIRYLDDLLNIDNTLFDSMVNHIYPSELQLNKANVSETEVFFWTCVYLYRMILLRLKYLINGMTLILIL